MDLTLAQLMDNQGLKQKLLLKHFSKKMAFMQMGLWGLKQKQQ
jgi:hypothetical protein